MSTIANLVIRYTANTLHLIHDVQVTREVLTGFHNDVEASSSSLDGLTGKAIKAGAAILGIGSATAAGGLGIKLAADAERAEAVFEVMFRSAQRARDMMEQLQDFSGETPFATPELTKAASNLAAFNFQQHEILPSLKAVGDVASAVNMSIGELANIYGKARVQGRLFAQDINQLTGRGIPIVAELAKQFGVAESEVRGLVESGAVNFSHLERAFRALSGEGGLFQNKMQALSETTGGAVTLLKNTIQGVLREFGTAFLAASKANEHIRNTASGVKQFEGVARMLGTTLGTIVHWVARIVEWLAQWKTLFVAIAVGGWAFVKVLTTCITVFSLLRIAALAWWALNTVAAWAGTTAGAVTYTGAISALAIAKFIAAKAAAVFWALMGPKGWLVLAGAAAAAAAGIYLVKRAMDGAIGSAHKFKDFVDSANSFDAAALSAYNREMQHNRELLRDGIIDQQQFDEMHRQASAVLHRRTQLAETARNKEEAAARQAERQADLQARAKEVLDSLNPALRKYEESVANLKELLAAGAISQDVYNAAMKNAAKALQTDDPIRNRINELKEEIALFGLSAAAVEAYKLKQLGATNAQIAEARALREKLDALERVKQAQEEAAADAKSLWEATRTPLEKYNMELTGLAQALAEGVIDWDLYARGVIKAQQALSRVQGQNQSRFAGALERGSAGAISAGIQHAAQSTRQDPLQRINQNIAQALAEERAQTEILRQQLGLQRQQATAQPLRI